MWLRPHYKWDCGGGGGVKTSLGDSTVESSLSSLLFKQTELFRDGYRGPFLVFFYKVLYPLHKTTLYTTPTPAPLQPYTHNWRVLSLLRLSSFLGTLSSGGNRTLCSRVVVGSLLNFYLSTVGVLVYAAKWKWKEQANSSAKSIHSIESHSLSMLQGR